jgi:hypothetical protein
MTDAATPAPETDLRPQPPPTPDDGDCCGNGCDPCIWDLHAAEVARYRDALRAWEARQAPSQVPAAPSETRKT